MADNKPLRNGRDLMFSMYSYLPETYSNISSKNIINTKVAVIVINQPAYSLFCQWINLEKNIPVESHDVDLKNIHVNNTSK